MLPEDDDLGIFDDPEAVSAMEAEQEQDAMADAEFELRDCPLCGAICDPGMRHCPACIRQMADEDERDGW